MASINFVQYVTVIPTEWLNETNTLVHTIGGNATTDAEFRTNIGVEIGTDVQAYDAGLQSISGLVTAADKMVYTTALDVYATTDLTAFARTILDDIDAGTVRTTIDAQQLNAGLTDISGLAVTDSNFIVGDGANWVAESGATARTSLGFTDGILDKASPGNIGASTPGTGAFTTLTVSDDVTVDANASGSGSVFGGATGGAKGAGTINAAGVYVNGSSIDNIPAGTAMVFFQAAAPTGWTKVVTQNDKALRVVSGSGGGSGGTHALSSPPSTSHTHTGPSHTHTLPLGPFGATGLAWNDTQVSGTFTDTAGVGGVGGGVTRSRFVSDAGGTGVTGSNGPTAFAPQYVDVIICTKD